MNKHAFVRNNPHFLYAGKKLKIPSLNEIMNLVKNEKKVTGGKNGYGSKLANIFSKEFIVETVDSKTKLKFAVDFDTKCR